MKAVPPRRMAVASDICAHSQLIVESAAVAKSWAIEPNTSAAAGLGDAAGQAGHGLGRVKRKAAHAVTCHSSTEMVPYPGCQRALPTDKRQREMLDAVVRSARDGEQAGHVEDVHPGVGRLPTRRDQLLPARIGLHQQAADGLVDPGLGVSLPTGMTKRSATRPTGPGAGQAATETGSCPPPTPGRPAAGTEPLGLAARTPSAMRDRLGVVDVQQSRRRTSEPRSPGLSLRAVSASRR